MRNVYEEYERPNKSLATAWKSHVNLIMQRGPKRKCIVVLILAVLFASVALLLWVYTIPPRAWRQIHVGDTSEQVRAEWPAVVQDLQDIKGDFCYQKVPLGYWRLWIIYRPDNRVSEEYCVLRLGTRNDFKDFQFYHKGNPPTAP